VPYLVASLAATGLCAYASWHLVERPALALKDLFRRSAAPLPA
jgi:peptidoglycan/LPS O-acetylase OafA/YrhL